MSFCISLLRIANVRPQIYAIYAVMIITVIFSIYYLTWILFQCHPTSYLWEQFLSDMKGKCRSVHYMVGATYAHGVVMCLGDLSLAILPVVLVRNLQLNRQTKASVAILLALGSMYVSFSPLPYYLPFTSLFVFTSTITDFAMKQCQCRDYSSNPLCSPAHGNRFLLRE